MDTISIRNILDQQPNLPLAGSILFDKVKDAVSNGEKIGIDMKDANAIPTLFLNTSFGRLISLYGLEQTKHSFVFYNITRSQADRLRKYFSDFAAVAAAN